MTFHDERLRGHGFLLSAAVGVRFFGGAVLLAAVLALAAGSARGQSYAADQTGDGFSAGAAGLRDSTSLCGLWTEKPGAEAPYLCAASRGPEGPRFHRFFPRAGLSVLASADFIRTTELISSGDSGAGVVLFSARVAAPEDSSFTLMAALGPFGDSGAGAALFPSAAAAPEDQSARYEPMTGVERLGWIVKNTLWPQHLAGGVVTSAVGTGLNRPREDGPHWGGFGERFGVRLTGVATSNVMEAGIGALWGEDPRYFPVPEYSFRARVKNVIVMTFLARRPDGDFRPAYARYIAFSGNNFLANAWRPDSEANIHDAVLRTLEGFAGRMASNAWDEFWPQAKGYIFHRGR